ncbi:unnamed protein product [Gongylonema pulchrum]|uniref:PRKCSH domain-containing protein n=1 Tax=Gongylonema pulchrum TaxID=637853 RepID=A0A183EIK2_9BILA|nr:unnamed protein product [Gongylonema pulchrum]
MRCTRLLLLSSVLLAICWAIYNVDELQHVAYDLEIADVPMGFENFNLNAQLRDGATIRPEDIPQMKDVDARDRQSLIVASEFGQKFFCSLPHFRVREVANTSKWNLTINLVSDVIAASFYVQDCIRRTTGWWTYELCYNKHVQQFHLDGIFFFVLLVISDFWIDSSSWLQAL